MHVNFSANIRKLPTFFLNTLHSYEQKIVTIFKVPDLFNFQYDDIFVKEVREFLHLFGIHRKSDSKLKINIINKLANERNLFH